MNNLNTMRTSNRILASALIFFGTPFTFLAIYWLSGNDFVRCRELGAHVAYGTLLGTFATIIPWLPCLE